MKYTRQLVLHVVLSTIHGGASGLLLTCILTAHLKINVTPRQTNAFYLFTFMSVQLIYANRQQ